MERKKRRGYRDSEGVGERAVASLSPPRKRAQSMPDEAGVLRITLGDEARASSDVGATVLLENADIAVEEGDTVTMAWTLERNLPKEAFLPTLLRAYDNIHARYTRMKARKMDIEAQFEEQRSSHARFQQVADRYIQDMCSENLELRKTLDAAEKKIKWLESLYLKRQKEGFIRGAEEADCEAAASPVRPLTPTSDQVGAEGAPLAQLPSEHAREEGEEEVPLPSEHAREEEGEEDVALPSEHAREAEGEEDVALPSEHAREAEGEEDVALPSEHAREAEGEEDVALPSEHAREAGEEDVAGCRVGDTAPQEIVENRGDEEILETEIGRDNGIAATHENAPNEGNVEGQHLGEDEASAAVPALESSLENARCLEDAAPAELDMAVVVCPEPIDSRSYLNEAEFQDLHRKYVELQNLHLKEVEVLDQQRREAELQFHRREEAELQNLHRKEVELQHLHRQEVAGLLLEVEMLQKVLGHFIGMTVASDEVSRARRGKPTLIFSHSRTGFRFTLELPEEQDEVAKDLELSYRNLSLGTLYRVAPWWMKEEFFCSVTQLGNFMRRFQETVTGRKLYS